jgi:hypothetical protein
MLSVFTFATRLGMLSRVYGPIHARMNCLDIFTGRASIRSRSRPRHKTGSYSTLARSRPWQLAQWSPLRGRPRCLCDQRPLRVLRLGLLYEPRDERLEVGLADLAFTEHALHRRANLGADLVAMRLGPVHLEVALDRLDDVVHQVAKERLVVHAVGILGDSVVEGDLLLRKAELARASLASISCFIRSISATTVAASMRRLW